jgi:hypothetical protein
MKTVLMAALAVATMGAPLATTPAMAQQYGSNGGYAGNGGYGGQNDRGWHGGDQNWDPADHYDRRNHGGDRRLGRDDQVYRGRDNRYYCRRSDGTTGTVIGALGGGAAGALLGGGTLGTLLGAGGGALLGRSVDRGHVKCR